MSNRLLRVLMFGLLCLSLSAVTACGDDGGSGNNGNNGNNGPECTTNDECGDDQICDDGVCVADEPECTEDAECGADEFCTDAGVCETGCRSADDCAGDLICLDDNSCGCDADEQCADGEFCADDNTCEPVAVQCESAGDTCGDSEAPVGEGFVCLVTEEGAAQGECRPTCSPGDTPTGCTSGTYCAALSQPGSGACVPSQCSGLGDAAGCDDEVAANPDAYPNGANCVSEGNDAFSCEPAGPLAEGDSCSTGFSGCQDNSDCPTGDGWSCEEGATAGPGGLCLQSCTADSECGTGFSCEGVGGGLNICLPQSCGQGMTCGFDGTCSTLCDGDAVCGEDDRCIGDDAGLAGQTGWGFCGAGCDAYGGLGQCSEGLGCFPVSDDDGICTEVGDTPSYEACDVGTGCETDADCPTDGWTCNNSRGVCQETCSTDADCSGESTCDVPETADTGFCVEPAQCSEGSRCMNLGNNDGRCMPVCNPTEGSQAAMDATCPQGNPTAYARFVHLAQGAGEVDIYVDGTRLIDNRGEGAGSATPLDLDFDTFDTGDITIEVVDGAAADNTAPLATLEATLLLNDQKTFAIVNGTDASDNPIIEILEVDVERGVAAPSAGEGRMNFALGADIATNVDLYILDDGAAFAGTETADFTDLSVGDATDFTASLAAGDYDVYVFEAGVTPLALGTNAIDTLDVTLAADSLLTFHIWGSDALAATAVEYDEGAETANDGFCFDISSDEATVNSGICFERCTGPEAYGQGQCSAAADNCSPFRANHVCLPSADIAVGDACDPFSLNACEAGAFCRSLGEANADGTPTGVCANQCVPGGSLNPVLGCSSPESCQPIGSASFNFGQCGFACEPTDVPSDYGSADCTEDFLMSCPPITTGEQAFCAPSNDVAIDAACGEVSTNNCVPNAVCRRPVVSGDYIQVLVDPVQGVSGPDGGVCQQRCELFTGDASGCPSGQECWVDGATLSPETGYCVTAEPALADIGALESCPAEHAGKMCGDGSICAGFGNGTFGCFEWCDTATGAGCGDGTSCQQLSDTSNLPVGLCIAD